MGQVIRPILRRVFPRERLFQSLDGMRASRAIWISAPSGSGKTTLINGYLENRKIPCLWHDVDETDGDAATFFYHLSQAEGAGGNGDALPLLTPEYLTALPAFTLRFFGDLFSRFSPRGVVVLANYDNLPPDSPVHGLISTALSAAPESVQFIFLSRRDPPSALIRPPAEFKMEYLGWDQLRLTLEEAGEIVRLRIEKTGKKEIAGLYRASDGWVAGLILCLARGRVEDGEFKAGGNFNAEERFRQLSEEVFAALEEEKRHFLLKTSFLPDMTVRSAEEITGLSSAGRLLSFFCGNNDFTEEYPHPTPRYRYHPLWRSFLAAQAGECFVNGEVPKIRQQGGRLLEGAGRHEDAAALYYEAKDWDSYIRIVIDESDAFLGQGRFRTLQTLIKRVPGEMTENTPALLFYLGACQHCLNPEECLPAYQEAFRLFQKRGDIPRSYLAAADILTVLVDGQKDCAALAPWLDWVTEQIGIQPHFFSRDVEAKVAVSLTAALLVVRPQHPDLRKWIERSLKLSREIKDQGLQIWAYINAVHWCQWMGDMSPCSLMSEQVDKIASFSASPLLMILKKWMEACTLNIGPAADFDGALEKVREGMKISGETGISVLNEDLLIEGVRACLHKEDLSQAGEVLKKLQSAAGTRLLSSCKFHYLSAWYYLLRGEYAHALFDSKTALSLALEIGAPFQEILCRLEMAEILKSGGETKNAALQLTSCGELLPPSGSLVLEYLYLLARARFSFDEDEEAAGLESLRSAMALGRSQGFVSLYNCWEAPVLARLCARALAEEIEVAYVRTLIRKHNLTPDASGQALENWPWPLRIYTLGQFKLEKEGKRLIFPGKAPQKALTMLKALIALGGRDVREEQITDSLWPESEGDTAHMGFKTLLSRLRQLLGLKDVIGFQGGKASFNPEICWVDTWAFEELYVQAKRAWEDRRELPSPDKAVRLAEAALDLYKGNFLQCDHTLDWTSAQRDRLRRKFHFLINRLGEHLQENRKWEEAVEHYEKAIEVDPSAEEFYQHLMTCYLQGEQVNEGLAVYRRLRKMVSEATGIAISRKTEAVYQSLLSNQTLAKRAA